MQVKKISTFDKIFYGLGSSSDAMHVIGFKVFAFFYYTQILQLPASSVGLAIACAILVDAISDPLVGLFSDKLENKYLGKRHLLMYLAIVPTCLCYYLMFSPPLQMIGTADAWLPGIDYESALFWYLLCVLIMFRVSSTFFTVPHLALGADMSKDYLVRSSIYSYHTFFLWVGSSPILFLMFQFVFPQESGGMRNADGYQTLGFIYSVSMAILMLVSTTFTLRFVTSKTSIVTKVLSLKQRLAESALDYKLLLTNKNYLVLFFAFFCLGATGGIHETLNSHLVTYYWQFTSEQYSYYSIVAGFAYLAMFVLGVKFHALWDKKSILLVGAIGKAILTSAPLILHEMDLMPAIGTDGLFYTVLTFIGMYYFTQSLLILTITSCLGDLADEFQLIHQRERQGMFYASRSFVNKAMTGVGTFVAGIGLSMIAFPLSVDIQPGTIDANILSGFSYLYLIGSSLSLVAFGLLLFYTMNRETHEKIVKQLGMAQ